MEIVLYLKQMTVIFVTYDDLYDKLSIKHIYTNDELLVEAFKSMYVNIGWVDFGYGSYSKDGLYKLSRTVTKKGDDMANTIKVNSGYGYSKINGNGGDDKLIGGRLHDVLMGGKGNDTLSAGSGYNELYGGEGNDILISENGYDHLYGGSGNDLYKMDGIDGIKEIYEDVWSNNVIEIEDKAPISIVLTKESEDLIITNDLYSSDGEITDKIILNDYYSNKDDVIESLTMGDKSISGQNIDLLIQAMSEYCSTNGVSWTNQLVESNTEVQNIITSYYTQV